MSVWRDLRKRSSGEVLRREDRLTDPLEEVKNQLSDPITFVGNIDKSGIPNVPESGQVYITNDAVTINGVEYPSGCMLIYDGNTWHNVGDYYRYQVVDAANHIGYYQPKLDNELSNLCEI